MAKRVSKTRGLVGMDNIMKAELNRKLASITRDHNMEMRRIQDRIADARAVFFQLNNEKLMYSKEENPQEGSSKSGKLIKLCERCPSEDLTKLVKALRPAQTSESEEKLANTSRRSADSKQKASKAKKSEDVRKSQAGTSQKEDEPEESERKMTDDQRKARLHSVRAIVLSVAFLSGKGKAQTDQGHSSSTPGSSGVPRKIPKQNKEGGKET